jgi:uncharacterized protein YchJ
MVDNMKDKFDNVLAKVQPDVCALHSFASTCLDFHSRVKSLKAKKSLTRSPVTTERAAYVFHSSDYFVTTLTPSSQMPPLLDRAKDVRRLGDRDAE